jgi:hypothetical protein
MNDRWLEQDLERAADILEGKATPESADYGIERWRVEKGKDPEQWPAAKADEPTPTDDAEEY